MKKKQSKEEKGKRKEKKTQRGFVVIEVFVLVVVVGLNVCVREVFECVVTKARPQFVFDLNVGSIS